MRSNTDLRCMAAAWLLIFLPVAGAQGTNGAPGGPAAEAQRAYNGVKTNLLKAAEAMSPEAYSFRPTPDIRTFARVVNHVTEAQLHSCGAALGMAPSAMPSTPPETADKAAIVQALQGSFATCDKAFAAATDSNAMELLTYGPGKRSRLGLLWGTVSHDSEQYATLALYLRLKGLVPPSSEK